MSLTGESAEFDAFAENYDDVLNEALSVSGEDKHYFALGRIRILGELLNRIAFSPRRILDYGCGIGTSVRYFFELLQAESVIGVDVSAASLDVARRSHLDRPAESVRLSDYTPASQVDLAFCNGVFHHIPIPERPGAAERVLAALRPGGIFAFWENNPWNPGARYCMRVNPFDRDAIPISSTESRRLLRQAGFQVIQTNYWFIFPKVLAVFRPLESHLSRLPIGGAIHDIGSAPTAVKAYRVLNRMSYESHRCENDLMENVTLLLT